MIAKLKRLVDGIAWHSLQLARSMEWHALKVAVIFYQNRVQQLVTYDTVRVKSGNQSVTDRGKLCTRARTPDVFLEMIPDYKVL